MGSAVTIEANLHVTTSVGDPAVLGLDLGASEPREPLLRKGVDAVATPLTRYLQMWEEPRAGDPDFAFDTRNAHGQRSPLLVADARWVDDEPWYEVYLPVRPNGRTA